jgi:DNA-binding PadR family transcriptional regulator
LVECLRERSHGEFDLAEGTVYPALHRLEAAGLLSSQWSREASRRRRVYQLTDRGRGALAAERQDWRGFAIAVEAVLS